MASAELKKWYFDVVFLLMTNSIVAGQLISLEEPVCCFNGTKHRPGSIVYSVEESCVDLVCAIDRRKNPATSVIVNVQKNTEECEGTPCKDCYDTSCVDQSGLVRLAGETWMPTKCFACECTVGQVVDCKALPVACEPRPNPSCEEIPGPCCPSWKCSDQFCVDDDGKRREIDEEWGGPCVSYSCSTRGILTSVINCVRPPPLNNSCELFTPRDECCPVVSCGCVDDNGIQRKLGEMWGGPCTEFTCTTEGVITRIEDCGPLPLLNDSCLTYTPVGKCCPEVTCGCVDNQGIRRKINETWGSPCINNTCTPKGIATFVIDCPDTSLLNSSCQLVFIEDQCCPEISCGCVDDQGIRRAINETWGTPCIVNTCTTKGVAILIKDCPLPPSLNGTCKLVFKPDECCPVVSCGSCIDANGIEHDEGSTWERGCTSFRCTGEGKIVEAPVNCTNRTLGEPEHSNCIVSVVPGKCCPEWVCGIDCALVRCRGPPGSDCVENPLLPLQCCPTYTCPANNTGCVDADGIQRAVGSKWVKGCTSSECVENGNIIEIPVTCPSINDLDRPKHANCVIGIPPKKCCPEWICGPDCALVLCAGPPSRTCFANGLPPLQCCPTYTCPQNNSGCIDATGTFRAVGSKWERGCTSFQCVEEGNIIEAPITCSSVDAFGSPSHSNCVVGIVPGKCCPEWICGPNCAAVLCLGPPSSTCIANEIPPLECCATYECPDVATTTTTERNIRDCKVGTTWIQDCLEHTCTADGIVSNPYQCQINPRPYASCTLVLPPGKCCLEWQCGKNAAEIPDESELIIPIPL